MSRGRLTGRRVVITGASSGIGVAAARAFAREGADLALLARSPGGLAHTAAVAREHGATAHAIPVDLTDRPAAERAIAEAADRLGGVDVFVSNHAAAAYGPFKQIAPEDFDHTVKITFSAAVDAIRAVLPELERSGGVLVANVSTAGRTGVPHQSPYTAAKHALRGFLSALRVELKADGSPVRVSMVHPSPIDTPFWNHATSAIGVQPKPLRSTYAPDVVAAALVECAIRPRDELTVGSSGLLMNALSALARPLSDLALATYGILGQRSDRPATGEAPTRRPSGRGEETGGHGGRGSVLTAVRLLRPDLLPLPGLRRRG
jgi:NAD(P)-dependent dehydrogenase (short-subunit alcohol dehydrogenase family)